MCECMQGVGKVATGKVKKPATNSKTDTKPAPRRKGEAGPLRK